jgi:NitT/TauT family transport system ATP-binding protein
VIALPAVEITGLEQVYGSGSQQVHALSNVHLEIGAQEFVCVVGPSGCGKTTLLNIVAGFSGGTSGSVRSFGKRVTAPGPDRTMMFQDYALFPWLSVVGNIEYGLKRRGMPKAERAAVAEHYVKLIELNGFETKYPAQLSGGMRQRVALARSLAVNPDVLLMDEPFAALDSFTRERLQDELIRVWQQEKKAVLFITHSIAEAIKLADRIVVMSPRPGRISEVIPVDILRPRDTEDEACAAIARRVRAILHLRPGDADPATTGSSPKNQPIL